MNSLFAELGNLVVTLLFFYGKGQWFFYNIEYVKIKASPQI